MHLITYVSSRKARAQGGGSLLLTTILAAIKDMALFNVSKTYYKEFLKN
jgi:hypothetical protein